MFVHLLESQVFRCSASSREHDAVTTATTAVLRRAKEMVDKGEGWGIVPNEVWEGYGGRMTWERFFSLMGEG